MNNLNKKIKQLDRSLIKNRKIHKIHNTNRDLKYWEWLYLEDENNSLIYTAVLHSDDLKQYEFDVSNSMKVPSRTGKRYGKK